MFTSLTNKVVRALKYVPPTQWLTLLLAFSLLVTMYLAASSFRLNAKIQSQVHQTNAIAGRLDDEVRHNAEESCAAREDLVAMQRLFLAEHAAIRDIMHRAGLPTEHADPELLRELDRLITDADCNPNEIGNEERN